MHKLLNETSVSTEVQNFLRQIHVYKDPVEAVIKTIIWWIAYIGGVLTTETTDDKSALGGAYFIFSLSMLMEFVPSIWEKEKTKIIVARILNMLWVLLLSISLGISVSVLFRVSIPAFLYKTMSVSVLIVLVYMVVDAILMLIIPLDNKMIKNVDTDNDTMEDESNAKRTGFEERLLGGALGDL